MKKGISIKNKGRAQQMQILDDETTAETFNIQQLTLEQQEAEEKEYFKLRQ